MVDKTCVRIRVQNLCFNLSQMVVYKQLNIFVKLICIPSIAILLQTFIYIQVYKQLTIETQLCLRKKNIEQISNDVILSIEVHNNTVCNKSFWNFSFLI